MILRSIFKDFILLVFCLFLLAVMFYLLYKEKSHYHFRVRSIKFHSLIWHFYLSDIFCLKKNGTFNVIFQKPSLLSKKGRMLRGISFRPFSSPCVAKSILPSLSLLPRRHPFAFFSPFSSPSPFCSLSVFLYQAFNSYEQNRYCPFGGKYRRGKKENLRIPQNNSAFLIFFFRLVYFEILIFN